MYKALGSITIHTQQQQQRQQQQQQHVSVYWIWSNVKHFFLFHKILKFQCYIAPSNQHFGEQEYEDSIKRRTFRIFIYRMFTVYWPLHEMLYTFSHLIQHDGIEWILLFHFKDEKNEARCN